MGCIMRPPLKERVCVSATGVPSLCTIFNGSLPPVELSQWLALS